MSAKQFTSIRTPFNSRAKTERRVLRDGRWIRVELEQSFFERGVNAQSVASVVQWLTK